MRREISPINRRRVSVGCKAPAELSDGVIRLRVPNHGDIEFFAHYGSNPEFLKGFWIPGPGPRLGESTVTWASTVISELISGWTDIGGRYGGAFIVDECEPVIGLVNLNPSGDDALEITYGVVPYARGRGIASRAAKLVFDWALNEGGFARVELRIDANHVASQRVAEKAGFRFIERFETFVEGMGKVAQDTLYIREHSPKRAL